MKEFVKKEAVLCIALLCALASMLLVPPDGGYADYVDYRVLALLFCLMLVVAGLQDCGLFAVLAAFAAGFSPSSQGGKEHKRHCDGNCANCPPHYGYRYGRWYYGKGHQYGCEFCGNKGDGSSS